MKPHQRPDGVAALAAAFGAGAAPELRGLDLGTNEIGDEGVAALTACMRDDAACPKLDNVWLQTATGFDEYGNEQRNTNKVSDGAVAKRRAARKGLRVDLDHSLEEEKKKKKKKPKKKKPKKKHD